MRIAKGPFGLFLGSLLAALLATHPVVSAQETPRITLPPLGKPFEGLFGSRDPAFQKKLGKRRLELLRMGWSEFWEREEALWRRIERLIKEGQDIDRRLLPLEKKKEEILARLRKMYREKRPLSERSDDLLALRSLARKIPPLAAKRARSSSEVKALLEEWALFQSLAQVLIQRESGRHQRRLAASIVDDFVEAFRRGDTGAVSKLLFRGVKVNGQFDQRAYLRRLENYFGRMRVASFEVKDRDFREVNPFTLRVRGNYALEEVEILKGGERKPRRRERNGPISFTLREIGGRWLISAMKFPD